MQKDRKETVKIAPEKGKLWLKCRNCRKTWYPDARKWRDKNPAEERIIRCPHCNVKNRIPRSIVRHLLDEANRQTEYGFGMFRV